MSEKEIYIVITQTGSIVSYLLKKITGAEYNHVSVSLTPDLKRMYSFGRRHPYNPWWGGFVMESPGAGTFKRFSETRAIVLSIPVGNMIYDELDQKLSEMLENKDTYHYDILGLLLAALNICVKREKYYYCSEFVRELLVQFHIENPELFAPIVQPMHFLNIPDGQIVYRGKLSDYSENAAQRQR